MGTNADIDSRSPLSRASSGCVGDRNVWGFYTASAMLLLTRVPNAGPSIGLQALAHYLGGNTAVYEMFGRNANHGLERIVVASSRAIDSENARQRSEHGQMYPQRRTTSAEEIGPEPSGHEISIKEMKDRRLPHGYA
jgi:hypothetical protein